MDDRILLPEGMTGDAHISFSALLRERLWVPDLFFLHATSIRRQKLFTPSEALQVYANKTIFLSSLYVKLMMEYSCPMKYTSYPLDRQSCDIIMESSGYPKERLNISWHPAGVRLPSQLHNHQFSVSISSGYHSQSTYPSGTYSAVGFRLNLQRKVQFYLLQAYLPESGPRVSYIKAMDVWMIGCMMFCFCCTVEYAVIIRFEQITNFSCTGHHQNWAGPDGRDEGEFRSSVYTLPCQRDRHQANPAGGQRSAATMLGFDRAMADPDMAEVVAESERLGGETRGVWG
ncbi:probable ligand-gated ion channel 46 [Pollicipes pollicipes]|uniref:probable ligand-gated ion channel 46 n=1 Tax=Pollicipes pollicipes TaxID=41117 RepID=UPI0018849793|nr:probable ligand-gated ion channel 46 [Pollicipes pollicipes]